MAEREVEVNKGMTMKMNDTGNVTELDMCYQVTQRKEAVRQLTVQEVAGYNQSEYYPWICVALDRAEEELEHYLLERHLKMY